MEKRDKEGQLLEPLPYHQRIRDFVRTHESAVWDWYKTERTPGEQAETLRLELLKSTYRLEAESNPAVYEAATAAAESLELNVPLTVYQAQNPVGLNASLVYLPGEAHIVLHGAVTKRLDERELRAMFGHELSHLLLWDNWDGDFLVTDQILSALTQDSGAQPAHFATARLFGLYTEVFCDRGAFHVVQDPRSVITMLVKMVTATDDVDADSYLRQLDEILANNTFGSNELTHPEVYYRARAVQLWAESDDSIDLKLKEMIEGSPCIDELDFLAQQQVSRTTRLIVDLLLRQPVFQTQLLIGHARLFFDDYQAPAADGDSVQGSPFCLGEPLACHPSLLDYYCYLLLDFATADRELEELPLAAALRLAEQLQLKDRFLTIARKELRLRKKQIEKLDAEKERLLQKAHSLSVTRDPQPEVSANDSDPPDEAGTT